MTSFPTLAKAFLLGAFTLLHTQCTSPGPTGEPGPESGPAPREGRQVLVAGFLTGDPRDSFRLRKPVHTEEDARTSFWLCGSLLADRHSDCWFDRSSLKVTWKEDQQLFLGSAATTSHSNWLIHYQMGVKKGGTLLKYRETIGSQPPKPKPKPTPQPKPKD